MPSSLLVRATFGLLVLATFAAFFVTQRLKRSTPVVERVCCARVFSPNGDGVKDAAALRFDLPRGDDVTVSVVDGRGDEVRRLADDRRLPVGGPHRFSWDGRTGAGRVAPDGAYRLRVTLRRQGRSVVSPREVTLDTRPPAARVLSVRPARVLPGLRGPRGRVRIRYQGPSDPAPWIGVYRTDGGRSRLVHSFAGPRFRQTAEWNGRVRGRLAPAGTYFLTVTVRDRAGNPGSAPARLPPTPADGGGRAGVTVRYLSVAGPLEPVAAGAVVRFRVGPGSRRLRWALSRLGAGRPLSRGRGRGALISLRVPRDARTGLHLLRVQAGGHRAAVPLVVRGRRRGRVLVVLPAITWQGRNPVDDDGDGFPNTLELARSAGAERAFAGGRLPPDLRGSSGPLLRFLDRERLPYDLTTDLALARGHGPRPAGRPGVAFPGSERWLTEGVNRTLRRFVEDGGKVASLAGESFLRRLETTERALVDPGPREETNTFGEATALRSSPQALPLVVTEDAQSVFDDPDGLVGSFSRVEVSEQLVRGADVVAAAALAAAPGEPATEAPRPAFVAYRLGGGLVIRVGTPQWNRSLASRIDVASTTRRIWALLSR